MIANFHSILAIMFAKLRMSVEEVSEVFDNICQTVYRSGLTPSQRTERLRESIQNLLESKGFPADLRLGNDVRQRDKITRWYSSSLLSNQRSADIFSFVVATLGSSMAQKIRLRTYPIRSEPPRDITVIDAILATCATQHDFLPVSIGPRPFQQKLCGGAIGAPSPNLELQDEVRKLYPHNIQRALLLTLGAGHPGPFTTSSDEGSEVEFHRRIQSSGDVMERQNANQLAACFYYFRFSVDQGLQQSHDVDIVDSTWINTQTFSYLEGTETQEHLRACVEMICQVVDAVAHEQPNVQGPPDIPVESKRFRILHIIGITGIIAIVCFCMLYPWTFLQ